MNRWCNELMESGEYSDSSRSETSDECEELSPRCGPVIDSTSYTVPGNPLAQLHENRLTPFSQIERLAPIPRQRSLVQQDIHAEASSHRLSRLDTPHRRENDCHTPSKRNREKKHTSEFKLPEIVPNDYLRSDEILDGLSKDGILTSDSKYIRHTRSGIAYHFMYGPPTRKPRRLPRIVSEGAVRQGKRKESCLVDPLEYRARSPRKQLNQKCYCSGGVFAEDIRCAVNNSRQKREQKNSERVRNQLQQRNDKVAMLTRGQGSATPVGDRAVHVQRVRDKQDELRQLEARKVMDNFMKKKKRKQ